MNRSILFPLMAAAILASCDQSPAKPVDQSQAAAAKGRMVANDMLAAAERDTDRARLSALEKQVDTLSAKLEASDVTILEGRIAALEAKRDEPVGLPPPEVPAKVADKLPVKRTPDHSR
ncbi:hypothetical protein [Sphingomonas faeni]|uniref:hypothetical protein n=1 Tax=Sphingomonas faeni TaxID=185950 RepID=UPI0020C7CB27|nr:hypothetical protein [Sphingomonas faeni]MCP8891735.1 hypothetical protein [Sphingomonas faeni]